LAKQSPSAGTRPIAVSNPLFKILLWIIVGVLFSSLIGMGLLAFFAPTGQTDFQRQFAAMCDTGFKMTLVRQQVLILGLGGTP
jgi:hypothetical protein